MVIYILLFWSFEFQCMSILVLNTPYEKIGWEFLRKLVMLLPKYLYAAGNHIEIKDKFDHEARIAPSLFHGLSALRNELPL